MEKKDYEKELVFLQTELLKFQYYVKEHQLKVLIIMEGRDAAGKGGTQSGGKKFFINLFHDRTSL